MGVPKLRRPRRRAAENSSEFPIVPEARPAAAENALHNPAAQMVIIALLAVIALVSTAQRISVNDGIDFFNFWGASHAERFAGRALGNPYTDGNAYLTALQERAV